VGFLFLVSRAKQLKRKEDQMMKRLISAVVLVTGLGMFLGATSTWSFNPGAHISIAEGVFSDCDERIDLYYGSIAPDLALQVPEKAPWEDDPFTDTHYTFKDLRQYAWGSKQRAFAKGWLTHNEEWGADYFAHIEYPLGSSQKGYVIQKAEALSGKNGLDPEFAHYAIEVTIDLLLKREYDHRLGEKLLKATLLRSWQDRYLLTKVFVRREGRTDWATLVSAELALRNLLFRYALPLALPPPLDERALIALGVQLAQEFYGISVSVEELEEVLKEAMALCSGDYYPVIEGAKDSITKILRLIPAP
jgi:hypothetical protein